MEIQRTITRDIYTQKTDEHGNMVLDEHGKPVLEYQGRETETEIFEELPEVFTDPITERIENIEETVQSIIETTG